MTRLILLIGGLLLFVSVILLVSRTIRRYVAPSIVATSPLPSIYDTSFSSALPSVFPSISPITSPYASPKPSQSPILPKSGVLPATGL